MKSASQIIFIILSLIFNSCQSNPSITMVTSLGKITLEIDTVHAPISAKNFLKLAKNGTLQKSCFYRTVKPINQPQNKIKIEVVQGGLFVESLIEKYPTIVHETTQQTGLKHLNGAISMARNKPGSASTEFFICIGDQPELDFGGKRNPDGQGFAAFGKVVLGMEVVKAIQQLPDSTQYLTKPVVIQKIIVEGK